MHEVTIEKLVHGGQGIGTLPDGRKVFVWNALPGERVMVELTKKKKKWAEGHATEILTPSKNRIEPKDSSYLATSPWQILSFKAENTYKADIIKELFSGEHVELPTFTVETDGVEWHYRNKMEYSFFGDDDGLHIALYARGTHRKEILQGSSLADPRIDEAARALVTELSDKGIRAADLKTVVLRSSSSHVVASLFVKPTTFPIIHLPKVLDGLTVYYSDPRSPASVRTKRLYQAGEILLNDTILDSKFSYSADSFFQVNVPVFAMALKQVIAAAGTTTNIVDMYGGVGSIGLSIPSERLTIVDIDNENGDMARVNAAGHKNVSIITASSETALDHISHDALVIFDPPRAGLHKKVIHRITDIKPPKIIYLSCNPATQARDIALLAEVYKVTGFSGYNFFPHTPHIETLAVLEVR